MNMKVRSTDFRVQEGQKVGLDKWPTAIEPIYEERLSRTGITRIRICSLAANASARASYERAGFESYEITYEKSVTHSCASE
jgi:hypothetical protein